MLAKQREEETINESKREQSKVLPLTQSTSLRTLRPKIRKHLPRKLSEKLKKGRKPKLLKSKVTKRL